MAAQARTQIAEQLADIDILGSPPPSAAVLQETLDQFEKVIELERNLLYKSIQKLENDLQETETEVSMKEEELMVWEEKLQHIQQANDVKLRLAKTQLDKKKWRNGSESRHSTGTRGASSLGFITECDEDSDEEEPEGEVVAEEAEVERAMQPPEEEEEEEEEEEDEEGTDNNTDGNRTPARNFETNAGPSMGGITDAGLDPELAESVEAINTLAGKVVGELAVLRTQWRQIAAGLRQARQTQEAAPASPPTVVIATAAVAAPEPCPEAVATTGPAPSVGAPTTPGTPSTASAQSTMTPEAPPQGQPLLQQAPQQSAQQAAAGRPVLTAQGSRTVATAHSLRAPALGARHQGGSPATAWPGASEAGSLRPSAVTPPASATAAATAVAAAAAARVGCRQPRTSVGPWRPGGAVGQAKPLGAPGTPVVQLSAR